MKPEESASESPTGSPLSPTGGCLDLEWHQLDRRYEELRLRHPERERRLLASLAENAQQVPIVVVALSDSSRYLVIDGFQRLRALERLGQDSVKAVMWDLDEAEALILDRSLRSSQKLSALEQGWLLLELHSGQGLSLEELAQRFDQSLSWISRRLSLVRDLPEAVQQHVRLGRIPAQAAMRYLVPVSRQSRQEALRLAEAIASAQLTTREVEKLYAVWLKGSGSAREQLLEDPRLTLRVVEESRRPAARRPADELVGKIERLAAWARQLAPLERCVHDDLTPPQRHHLQELLRQSIAQLEHLEKEIIHAESRPPDLPRLGNVRLSLA